MTEHDAPLAGGPRTLRERFADGLDETVWTPAYLPAWSSRSDAAASFFVDAQGLHLTIPDEHPLWCPGLHEGALRVSAVQSGNWSGPVGSTRGQQPFRSGLVVREEQPARWGYTPEHGHIEVVCRAVVGPGSMWSAWLVGLEDVPERSGEICLVEVFGSTVETGADGVVRAAVGSGIHPFRDPGLREEFDAPRMPLDVRDWHRYAVDWRPGSVTFSVDGETTRTLDQAPAYPLQLILGVFDFPDQPRPAGLVPELVVRSVTGTAFHPDERGAAQKPSGR